MSQAGVLVWSEAYSRLRMGRREYAVMEEQATEKKGSLRAHSAR